MIDNHCRRLSDRQTVFSVMDNVVSGIALPPEMAAELWTTKIAEFKGAIEKGLYDNELLGVAISCADKKLDAERATQWLTDKLGLIATGESAGSAPAI